MSTVEERLSTDEVVTWLNNITRQLDQSTTGKLRDELTAELRRDAGAGRAGFRALASVALLDDCLRVAHLATDADGHVEDAELERVLPLARAAAPRFFAVLPGYEAWAEPDAGDAELIEFLHFHRDDAGRFRDADPSIWRGVRLSKRVAAATQNEAIPRDLERMLVTIMDAVFADRDSVSERAARERLRALFESRSTAGTDPRASAFCRADAPEVFSSIAHGMHVFERDPFDVDTIHGEARTAFLSQIERAVTPSRQGGAGASLLVLGAGGSGKTHLLRAFRTSVHERGLGYVGYLQMSSDVGDYSRYLLAKLIDSLERPYNAPDHTEAGLLYLANGLAEHDGVLPPAELERLRTGELDSAEFPSFLGGLVDRLVRTSALAAVDSDLVQALLLLQRRDPAIQRRVIKFLRCEPLTSYEQAVLGGLSPRLQPEDPVRTVIQLGQLAYQLQLAALVLLIDQVEDAMPDHRGHERIQRAFDAVRNITDALPSAVIVIACLDDVYDEIRPRLSRSLLDRLERDPPPVRLTAQRSRSEIEVMLARRLEYLYDATDAGWREDDPIFPFRPQQLDALANARARDCLATFKSYQDRCIAAGTLLEAATIPATAPVGSPTESSGHEAIERAWNDALVAPAETPDDDAGILRLVEHGLTACAEELRLPLTVTADLRGRPRLSISHTGQPPRVMEVCNRQAQGGHLARQLEALRDSAVTGEVAIALRTSEFAFGPRAHVTKVIGSLVAAGGRAVVIEDGDLRAVAAFASFLTARGHQSGFAAWRAQARPVSRLDLFRKVLDLDQLAAPGGAVPVAPPPAPPVAPPRVSPPAVVVVAPPPIPTAVAGPGPLRLGVTPTMRGDAITLDPEALKTHAAFLGGTGSGKTTLALNVVEQLLERDVSVLLVDRKGDLARYASDAWWAETPADAEAARRKQSLRARVRIDLFTPGEPAGRPLRLPIVPAGMHELSTQEKDQVASAAAAGLAAMLGYGRGESHRRRAAILKKAIELHADGGGASLDALRDTIAQPDPALLAAVGNLTRHFSAVAEDLDTLAIQRGHLLSGAGEVLDVAAMLARPDGRPRLTIVSAMALTEPAVLQFFVSRLLVELARMVRRTPQSTLRTVALFDEADIYIPAVSAPPTKEPMFELLRRARSGGLGVFLATQNPGDLDYRARDNIATWLVGKVGQPRTIEKMRHIIGPYPNVAGRLAAQTTGSFFLINSALSPLARELRADASLMKTDQMQEHEIAALARATAERA